MSDNFVQQNSGTGIGSVNISLPTVVAGNSIHVIAIDGSSTAPTGISVSDAQGAYSAQGSAITDVTNNCWGQSFVLQNCNSGTHSITFSTTSGGGTDALFIYATEIGTTAGTGAVSGSNAAKQSNPGTGANVLSSGNATVTGAATLSGFAADTSSINTSDEPTAGTSPIAFTSRANNANTTMGAWRAFTAAAAANAAATAGPVTGTHEFFTFVVAILNAPAATDQPPSQVYYPDEAIGTEEDTSPFDWYADGDVVARQQDTPAIPPELPDSSQTEDITAWEDPIYQWPWGTGPPPNDDLPQLGIEEDAGTQPEWPLREDEDFGVYEAPLSSDDLPQQGITEFGDLRENDLDDESFGFETSPPPADVFPPLPLSSIEDSSNQPEYQDEDFGFSDTPAPSGAVDQLVIEDGSFQPQEEIEEDYSFFISNIPEDFDDQILLEEGGQPEDEEEDFGFYAAPLDITVAADIIYGEDSDSQLEEEETDGSFADSPLSSDDLPQQGINEGGQYSDPEDEDFGFFFPVAIDDIAPDQIYPELSKNQPEYEDEDFGTQVEVPLSDDVQSNQVFVEDGSIREEDIGDEDFGFSDLAVEEIVIQSDQVFVEDGSEQPENPEEGDDFSFSFDPLPDDVIPPVPPQQVEIGGGERKKKGKTPREELREFLSPTQDAIVPADPAPGLPVPLQPIAKVITYPIYHPPISVIRLEAGEDDDDDDAINALIGLGIL